MSATPPEPSTPARQVPPKSILRLAGRAIGDFDMIREGDRVLVGVSGGKDSLSLLHLLLHLATYAPVRFEVGGAVQHLSARRSGEGYGQRAWRALD